MVYLPRFYLILWLLAAFSCLATLEIRGLFFTGVFISAMKWSSAYTGLWDSSLNMLTFDLAWVVLIYMFLPGKFGEKLAGLTALMVVVDSISYFYPDMFGIFHNYYRLNTLNLLFVLQCTVIIHACYTYHRIPDDKKGGDEDGSIYARQAIDVFGPELAGSER